MTRRFILFTLIGLGFFIGMNLISAHLASDCGLVAVFGRDFCADDIARAGWPLRFYEAGGFDERYYLSPGRFGLDLLIGVIVSGTIGWYAARRVK